MAAMIGELPMRRKRNCIVGLECDWNPRLVLQLMMRVFCCLSWQLGYVAAVVSFRINSGAYVYRVIRAGIMAVDKASEEAEDLWDLDIRYNEIYYYSTGFKNILPAMGNELYS